MSNPQFTSGPWKHAKKQDYYNLGVTEHYYDVYQIMNAKNEIVAKLTAEGMGKDKNIKANAALIKEICVALHDLSTFLQMPREDKMAEIEATLLIRELRQIIERLRRIVDDGEPNEDAEDARIYRMVDVWKLPKDVLVKVVWEFLQWHKSKDGECPALYCKDYPCKFKHERKEELAENLANGDLDQETYDKYMAEITEDMYDCDDDGEGCWASYYVWYYLNGYNPLNGKKEAK